MEKSAILHADFLDIVFEGRNKAYGAYELRRTYNRRLGISIAVMLLLILMFCIGNLIAGRLTDKEARIMVVEDRVLSKVDLPDEEPLPPPPAEPPHPQKPVKSIQFATPKIVPPDQVKDDEMPPADKLEENVKIDVVTNNDGEDFLVNAAPPKPDEGRDIVAKPKETEPSGPFTKVEKESEFPGGRKAWERFLIRNLNIPQEAIDNRIQGEVMVQFIVDREGNVSKVEAISGPMELRAEAVRVIKKSGRWTPAIQNGIKVPSYKKQPIIIKIVEE